MHNRHGWTERLEDGLKREVRAEKFGGRWTIASRLEGEEQWARHDPPSRSDLEVLLDHLKRKYQRRRASWDDVTRVEELLRNLPPGS